MLAFSKPATLTTGKESGQSKNWGGGGAKTWNNLEISIPLQSELVAATHQLSQQAEYCSTMGASCSTLLWRVSKHEESIHSLLSGVCLGEIAVAFVHLFPFSNLNINIISSLKLTSSFNWSERHWQATLLSFMKDSPLKTQRRHSLCSLFAEQSQVTHTHTGFAIVQVHLKFGNLFFFGFLLSPDIAASAYGREHLSSCSYGLELIDILCSLLVDIPHGAQG